MYIKLLISTRKRHHHFLRQKKTVFVRYLKLSSVEHNLYLNGLPLGNIKRKLIIIQILCYFNEAKNLDNISRCSQAVTHLSTDCAQRCLVSGIEQKLQRPFHAENASSRPITEAKQSQPVLTIFKKKKKE
ncbi:hypothetical protein PUN28_019116 [Cardiocondyla obscurior]|uniref:Uncharacterized protein n=1 Tax=Cardiocondyla obscurior TaxID=286306 RepID=A0AAW2EEF0_9HYME